MGGPPDCWYHCRRKGGNCKWCSDSGSANGKCCRQGWNDPGCSGLGCPFYHCCA